MAAGRTPFLVGLMILMGIAAFVFTFGALQRGVPEQDSYEVFGVFDDATGLVENGRVTLSGIPVGQISRISLDPDEPSKARVTIRIRHDVVLRTGVYDPSNDTWVNGATLVRKQASLLGDYYIAVSPGVAGPALRLGDRIHNVIAESGLSAVVDRVEKTSRAVFPKLEQITTDIQAITRSVRSAIGTEEGAMKLAEIRDTVTETTRNVAAISGELRGFMRDSIFPAGDTIARILRNVEGATRGFKTGIVQTTSRLEQIMTNIERFTGNMSQFLAAQTEDGAEKREGTLARTIAKLDENMTSLKGTLDNVRSVTSKIDRGQGTLGRLVNDDGLLRRFEGLVDSVNDFTSRYARLQVEVDFRSEYLFGQSSMKHYVSLRLRPRPDKYYFFQVVDDPRGKVSVGQRVTTSNDPSKPPVLAEEIVETSSGLKFTAQFAKRWHFLTFRYGILESTGGWGIDLDLLEDALRFKLDIFDFSFQSLPRVRLLAAWEFVRHVYISAGIDDMLNNDERDYFFGMGATFTDADLKSALPLVPTGF